MRRAEIIFDGEVQGVGFRYYVRRVARRLKLVGYVENLADGRVKVVCEGEEQRIEEMIRQLRSAPPPIKVEHIETSYSKPTGEFKVFQIITGDLAQEMVEGFSTGAAYFEVMFQKQDQMLSKQDQLLAKQDQMLAKQDQMLSKQDEMLAKQDETLGEIRGLRQDLRSLLDERLARIERDIAEIKARLGLS